MCEVAEDGQANNGGSHYSLHSFYDAGAGSSRDSLRYIYIGAAPKKPYGRRLHQGLAVRPLGEGGSNHLGQRRRETQVNPSHHPK
jgi:hypothetical protein